MLSSSFENPGFLRVDNEKGVVIGKRRMILRTGTYEQDDEFFGDNTSDKDPSFPEQAQFVPAYLLGRTLQAMM